MPAQGRASTKLTAGRAALVTAARAWAAWWQAQHARGAGVGVALAALAGALTAALAARLPAPWLLLAAVLSGLVLLRRAGLRRLAAVALLAWAWTGLQATRAIEVRLPPAWEGRDIELRGQIVGLPWRSGEAQRFDFDVQAAHAHAQRVPLHGTVRLSWYGAAPALLPCQRMLLTARLKRPHAGANPGGQDGERQAVLAGIHAVGYVRSAGAARDQPRAAAGPCVDALRARISARIAAALPAGDTATPLLQALAVGDQRGLGETHWQVLRATGIGHLIAISGLHVGLAGIAGAALVHLLTLLWPRLLLWRPRRLLAAPVALAAAWAYGALAGYGLPTVRTLLMIAVVALAVVLRRHAGIGQVLAAALLAVLLVDPLAVLGAGFWLSFVGVAMLALVLVPGRGWRRWLLELGLAQGVMTLALLPLTVLLFGQASRVGPLANLIAVPLIGLLIVPLVLLAGLGLALDLPGAALLLQLPALLMRWQWALLEHMAQWPGALAWLPWPGVAALTLAVLGVLLLLAPRGVPLRAAGVLLLLPLLWPRIERPPARAFEAWVLDVGQGSAVLLRTAKHAMLYDAGPRLRSGFDLGAASVLPSLQALGVQRLDVLLIGHGDADHAGGAPALHAAYPQAPLLGSEAERVGLPLAPCRRGQHWQWDGVSFRVLHPRAEGPASGNEASCVLLVQSAYGSLLLPGDIGLRSESQLLEDLHGLPAPRVLLLAHHGSGGSNGAPLLAALQPRWALVSAGHRNAYGHPHARVRARLAAAAVSLLQTAEAGALRLRMDARGARVEGWRDLRPRWWRE